MKGVVKVYAQRLQNDLDKLEVWEQKWQMAFNVDKCHLLSVTKKRKRVPTTYSLHGQALQQVPSAKYLGVEISESLHWGKHVEATAAKANRSCAFACRNLKGCPTQVQAHCYKGLVRPVLDYASPVWDPHQQHLKTTLEMVQRRAARRILSDFSPTSSASEMVDRLKLDQLDHRRTADKACMLYRMLHGLVDVQPPTGLCQPATRTTRGHQQKLQVPHSRTDVYLHSFFPSATRIWNALSAEVVASPSLPAFQSAVHGWLRAH